MERNGIARGVASTGCQAAENTIFHRSIAVQRDGVPGRLTRIVIPAEHEAGIGRIGGVVHRDRAAVCPIGRSDSTGIACCTDGQIFQQYAWVVNHFGTARYVRAH